VSNRGQLPKSVKTERFRCDFVTVSGGYQFLEIEGDREAYLGDFALEGLVKAKILRGVG
jgi:hypothetical protein